MRRWILITLAAILLIVVATALTGMTLPKDHRASRAVVLAAAQADVFAVVSDFLSYPQWRSDVKSVVVDRPIGVGAVVHEDGTNGPIPYRVEVFEPPARLVLRIADPSLPFGGTWTYELKPAGGGTELTLTEDGEVYNPIFRVMQKLFFSPYSTVDAYLRDLQRKLEKS